ncbi:MAG: BatA domain-containing protein, partial [Pirellulaceae bacterium]
MTFLGLAFLAALPLAAAPILLHLFDRRRTVVIEWGAMQFLMEASSRKTSARRFQHWLLLLLRVLAIAALVLALARPLVELSWFPSYDATETVLVIDTSLSTMQRHAEATAFDELMQRSTAKVRELASGSAIRILVTSPYPAWATPASVRLNDATRDELVALITTLRPTEGTGDIPAALLKAVQSESESDRVGSRELVVLTDGQRVDWQAENIPAWQQFQAAWQAAPLPTSLEIVQLRASADSTGNLAIADMRIQGATTGPGQPFTVTAQLHNFAREASAPTTIEWLLGEERLTTTEVPSIGAGATHEVRWQHALDGSGVYAVGCRLLSEDALAADNRESRILEVVDRVPVLLVEDASGYTEIQQDTYLIRAALGHIEGETRDGWHAVFEPRTVAPDQLDTIRLEDFRVVVIPNLTALADEVVARLEQFVSGGGGLWLALGPRTDRDVFDRQWFREGAGLVPLRLGRIVDEPTDPLLQPTINPFLKAHPATAQLANYHQLDLGDVKVSRRYRFSPADGATPVPVLLELSNGDPLAVEHRVGLGRVIVQAVPLRLQWSDLA